ncbi:MULTISPECIES: ABC transporter ATP-binding protein/permease [unclassified Pseudomonas]|uniref:ABC transporter ATP-binding protein/permease n=1 Tax=unclassified Pseudomonas TaxID=196821 RepID=UPI0023B9B005|nr:MULTISPECIES: ABC transporter ATP-binding protein/permease [unclassified Pseudomonas]
MKTLRMFFMLARPFWGSRAGWPGWALLGLVFAMGIGIVQANVYINAWSKRFYDTLATFDGGALLTLMGDYSLAIAALIAVIVSKNWLTKALILRWRQHLNDYLLERWLGERRYYRLGLSGEPDHPDQRIAEDAYLLSDKTVGLVVSLFINTMQIGAFVSVLWQLSGTQTFTLGDYSVTLDGYLVWAVVIYTLIGTLVTHWLGRPLHGLNYERQRSEAAFRTDLLRKRDHAEQIALYGGEEAEQQGLRLRFSAIANNWRSLMQRELKLGTFTVGYERVRLIVPVFIALPAFLAKTITLGGLMQIRTAFGAVYESLSWFIFSYRTLMEWSATVERLGQFQQAMERLEPVELSRGDTLNTCGLDVLRPNGEALLCGLTLHAQPGEWLRLAGASGLGKSTLLRTLMGLWPHHRGTWQLPGGRSLLLPQKPYLASGRLDEALAYPAAQVPNSLKLIGVLKDVGLEHLIDKLDREAEWGRELSGGEQQRLALARALLYRPDTLYLDEATNQLDDKAACQLLERLRQRLPNCTLIAVSHQPAVQRLFERSIDLQECGAACRPAKTEPLPA